jgi:hypothetical protein
MTENKITKKKINEKCSVKNKIEKIPHLPCSYECPTNPLHPIFLRI